MTADFKVCICVEVVNENNLIVQIVGKQFESNKLNTISIGCTDNL
jgi:hypothetical protein